MAGIRFSDAFKIAFAFALIAAGLFFVYTIGDILVMFLAAFLFAIALDKPLDKLVEFGLKRYVAVVIIYSLFFVVVMSLTYLLLPPLAQEIGSLTTNLPTYVQESSLYPEESPFSPEALEIIRYVSTLSESLVHGSQTVSGIFFKVSDGFITFLVVFFASLFLNLPEYGVKRIFTSLTPVQHRDYARGLFSRIEKRVGLWLWGKSVSSFFVGCIIFVGLFIIGIEYAITFAIFAAFLNFIPFIGPFFAAIVPVFLGLIISPTHAFAVAALYLAANSLENFILIPALMKSSINLNPVLLIFVVLVGGKIGGILGVLISIPVAAILTLAYEEYTALTARNRQAA